MLSPDRELAQTAAVVEATVKAIIDDAAAPLDPRQALTLRRAALAREIEAGIEKRRGETGDNVPDSGRNRRRGGCARGRHRGSGP